MSTMGGTTVEGKSGYGLDRETELLQLKVMRSLNNTEHKRVDIVSTFLGAHALPEEYAGRSDEYIDFLIREMLPLVRDGELAECCDVFWRFLYRTVPPPASGSQGTRLSVETPR